MRGICASLDGIALIKSFRGICALKCQRQRLWCAQHIISFHTISVRFFFCCNSFSFILYFLDFLLLCWGCCCWCSMKIYFWSCDLLVLDLKWNTRSQISSDVSVSRCICIRKHCDFIAKISYFLNQKFHFIASFIVMARSASFVWYFYPFGGIQLKLASHFMRLIFLRWSFLSFINLVLSSMNNGIFSKKTNCSSQTSTVFSFS